MVLIDLYAQREAFAEQVGELELSAKLAWLRHRGELIELQVADSSPRTFRFRSSVGIECGFFIREGKLVFLGDHTALDSVDID